LRVLIGGVFSFSCGTLAATILFLRVTTTFVSVVAVWRGLVGRMPWPGPDPGLLYLGLLFALPLLGAVYFGRAVYARLVSSPQPLPRLTPGALLGFVGWLIIAAALARSAWR
jgi:hypothetical protein